jgi:hypothetical protein
MPISDEERNRIQIEHLENEAWACALPHLDRIHELTYCNWDINNPDEVIIKMCLHLCSAKLFKLDQNKPLEDENG